MNEVIRSAMYNAFYDLIAIALETGNTKRAGDHMCDAYEQLSPEESERLEKELTADYYEFT